MKILTLNTHSLIEGNTQFILDIFSKKILKEHYDIIALQEVNQPMENRYLSDEELLQTNYCQIRNSKPKIKVGNYAWLLAKKLSDKGKPYFWSWEACHIGYGIYEEGVAIFSKRLPQDIVSYNLSNSDNFTSINLRKMIGCTIVIDGEYLDFYSLHLSWYDKGFLTQWKNLNELLHEKKNFVFLLGDFNIVPNLKGYCKILESGWYDTYDVARRNDDGNTVLKKIDGWDEEKKQRIDYVFVNRKMDILESRILFNNIYDPYISDHCAIQVDFNI